MASHTIASYETPRDLRQLAHQNASTPAAGGEEGKEGAGDAAGAGAALGPASEASVVAQGFMPLRKTMSAPAPAYPQMDKRLSFNTEAAANDPQAVWARNPWKRVQKTASFVASRGGADGERQETIAEALSEAEPPTPPVPPEEQKAVAVVDPFSSGAHVARYVNRAGYICVRVFCIFNSPVASLVQEGVEVDYAATVQHDDRIEDQNIAYQQTADELRKLPWEVVAVIPGAETGVELADILSDRMGLRTNGEELTLARRNKYIMGETVRAAGVRAVKQKLCRSAQDVDDFLAEHNPTPFKVVVKPVQSAGSDDVFLCDSPDEARESFAKVFGHVNGLGLMNDAVLIQEFLAGNEFVIDSVSVDGVHKNVAIWEYIKRPANGSAFVYFGMKLRSADSERGRAMVEYSRQVLDAVKIANGPSHMEVMYCADGPCLVEVGSRCHGGEGTWIPVADECIGYNQCELAVDVYIGAKRWQQIPERLTTLRKHGRDVDMVARYSGILRGFSGEEELMALPSYRTHSWEAKIGDFMPKTIDCFTRPGCVQFVHVSEEQVDADLEEVHRMEFINMFDYAVICPEPPPQGAVVIVDPFSSGARLAASAVKMGFKLIMVFSEPDSPVAAVRGGTMNAAPGTPQATIQHDATAQDPEKALEATLASLREHKNIMAILPGCETGVELADRLSARFGTRTNGEALTRARRNKFDMHETLKERGVRALPQRLCSTADDVTQFWEEEQQRSPGAGIVLKPPASSGTDMVKLCTSLDEAQRAFEQILVRPDSLGHHNTAVLAQSYLEGEEFAVDTVTRDGKTKVLALWRFDVRPANDSAFVPHGMTLVEPTTNSRRAVIEYVKLCLQALEIRNGAVHCEVIVTNDGPVLVELGARAHGGEATWVPIVDACIGYNQLEAVLEAYLRPDRFDAIPAMPTLKQAGAEVFLVSHEEGTLGYVPGIEMARSLPTFSRLDMATQPGSRIVRTTDMFTRPGSVQLIGSAEQVQEDYNRVHLLMRAEFFQMAGDGGAEGGAASASGVGGNSSSNEEKSGGRFRPVW